jgi:hypothetical protein
MLEEQRLGVPHYCDPDGSKPGRDGAWFGRYGNALEVAVGRQRR